MTVTSDQLSVDTLILDIDGVLVDVSNSYRRAIVETVDHLYGTTIPRESVQAFKNAGGFNNDWELTDAVALYVLARDHGYTASIEDYTDAIHTHGGGLTAAKDVLKTMCDNYSELITAWDPAQIRQVFQQLYLGTLLYRELEDEEPMISSEGFINDEPVLITTETIDRLSAQFNLGVLTGRPGPEAELALTRVGLDIPPEFRQTMSDGTPGKPHPDGLILLANRLEANTVAFVGDTLDDITTAVNANTTDPTRAYYGIGVLTGGLTGDNGRLAYDHAGATATINSVNDLLDLLTTPF